MTRLPFILILLLLQVPLMGQSPHGEQLKLDCAYCHNPAGWTVSLEENKFDHGTTDFMLEGTHTQVECRSCHSTLIFDEASSECISCHLDVHSQTVGNDCVRCHNSETWLVNEIPEIHEQNGFPLIGAHANLSCVECHASETNLRFDRIGNDCISCHQDDYLATSSPNHQSAGYSTNCIECHSPLAFDWRAEVVSHDFFPLVQGHDIDDCAQCHNLNDFSDISPECVSYHANDLAATTNPDHQKLGLSNDCAACHSLDREWNPARFDMHDDFYPLVGEHAKISDDCFACHAGDYNNTPTTCVGCHQSDYNSTSDPNHASAGFSTNCVNCHTEDGWEPASFDHDAQFFPIYSGTHKGEWDDCVECHTNPSNFSEFSCIGCHKDPQTSNEHNGVPGYAYESNACLACHPTGEESGFNHNNTDFPLTGVHNGPDCIECHANGYVGTSTECKSCHQDDFNGTQNPNHSQVGFSTDCASCHTTTDLDWQPATFADHNSTYALNGAHAAIANDCVECHNGNYNNTPNTCVGCHQSDFNATASPNHTQVGFSNDCATCHSENAWQPASFDHDGQYFPIYSGTHQGEWNDCVECHTNPNNFAEFSCIGCHTNPQTNNDHNGVAGYAYQSSACLACHPTGDGASGFDHNATNFPLIGVHNGPDCIDCHANGYAGTSTVCSSCHMTDYNGTSNPKHTSVGFSTDCASCHSTTDPDWQPATFANHNSVYALNGAHAAIANDCVDCHNGNYNNTPNTCVGCHQSDYNSTNNPNHSAAQFPTDCATCHGESNWTPSTFDHDGMYFEIYSGKHKDEWNDCIECHTNPNNYADFTCLTCHTNPSTNNDHNGVNGYQYVSTACLSCHPNP